MDKVLSSHPAAIKSRRWRALNPDKSRAIERQRYRRDRVDRNARSRRYAETHREAGRTSRNKIFARGRTLIHAAKARPCADCGVQFPPYVMDFDHRDPQTKAFGVGGMKSRRVALIETEIAKCDVVCANCHRERTHRRRLENDYPGAR